MAAILSGKLALVTGAASGIGKSVCELFAKQGASVIAAGLQDVHGVAQSLTRLSDDVKHFPCTVDVSSGQDILQMMTDVLKQYKCTPSIAVNCAGITRDSFLLKMSEEDFNQVIDVNLKLFEVQPGLGHSRRANVVLRPGTFLLTKLLSGHLIQANFKDSSIINIASIVGKTGNIGQANYTASKAGVVAFTKTSAMELARYGIRCNAVLPGFIKTQMTDVVPDKVKEGIVQMVPMGRMGEPEDIAEACLFLASDKSRYITGASIEVTGGLGM